MHPRHEVFQECLKEALNVVRYITKETEEEQTIRRMKDVEYSMVVHHITNLYFLIKTNECFKHEQEELSIKVMELMFDREDEFRTFRNDWGKSDE